MLTHWALVIEALTPEQAQERRKKKKRNFRREDSKGETLWMRERSDVIIARKKDVRIRTLRINSCMFTELKVKLGIERS